MRVGERVELINMEDRSIWQDRCLQRGKLTGVVRFVGALYVGVELDEAIANVKAWRRFGQSTDGTLYGKRYFRTSVGCGIFISSQNVRRIVETRHTRSGRVFARPERVVDLNSCTAKDLEKLRGIGPILARRILRNRPYRSLNDLSRVERLSRTVIESLRSHVRFGSVVATKTVQKTQENLRRERVMSYEKKMRELQVRIAREKIARDREARKKAEEEVRVATMRRLEERRRLDEEKRRIEEEKKRNEQRVLRRLIREREEKRRKAEKDEEERRRMEDMKRRVEEKRRKEDMRRKEEMRRKKEMRRNKANKIRRATATVCIH